MKITIPEVMESEPKVVPDGAYTVEAGHIMIGTSQSGNPKMTVKWIIAEGEHAGTPVFDTYAVIQSTIWKINQLYRAATGDRLPQGDYTVEQLVEMIRQNVVGRRFSIVVAKSDDSDRMEVRAVQLANPVAARRSSPKARKR